MMRLPAGPLFHKLSMFNRSLSSVTAVTKTTLNNNGVKRSFAKTINNFAGRTASLALKKQGLASFLSQFFSNSKKMGTVLAPKTAPEGMEIATVAGGCFWSVQLAIDRIPGVTASTVGYTAGKIENPTYDEVCSGRTGHTEAVQAYYNPKECSFGDILDVFFNKVDPTTLNRQGGDVGTQYRSSIFYENEAQKQIALEKIRDYEARTGKKVVTTVEPAQDYFIAEEYHQKYLEKGGRFGRAQSAAKGCTDPIRCYG